MRRDDYGAPLTRRLVDAARARVEHSMSLLSVRRALLFDPRAGVAGADVERWLSRGEEILAAGAPPASEHDELCVELARMDTARGGAELARAGAAARRILDSRDPRAYSAQVKLIGMFREAFGEQESPSSRPVGGLSQEDMDAMSPEELERVETLLSERAEASRELERIAEGSRRRRVADADERLH